MKLPVSWLVLAGGLGAVYFLYKHTVALQVLVPDATKTLKDVIQALKTDPLAGIPPSSDGNTVLGTPPVDSALSGKRPNVPLTDISQTNNPSAIQPPPASAP